MPQRWDVEPYVTSESSIFVHIGRHCYELTVSHYTNNDDATKRSDWPVGEKYFMGTVRQVGSSIWWNPPKDRYPKPVSGVYEAFADAMFQACSLHDIITNREVLDVR